MIASDLCADKFEENSVWVHYSCTVVKVRFARITTLIEMSGPVSWLRVKGVAMMEPRRNAQGALIYEFSIEGFVPQDHPVRGIDRFVDLSDVRPLFAALRDDEVLSADTAIRCLTSRSAKELNIR